jgi:hypothetical protein
MNEAQARETVLVQAFETATAGSSVWTVEDSAWATRVARESAGTAPLDVYAAQRAQVALQRLAPRDPAIATVLARRWWNRRWWWLAAVAGLALGVAADVVGAGQRIDLLSPAVWGVVAWNVVVLAVLAVHALRQRSDEGLLRRLVRPIVLPALRTRASSAAWHAFAAAWTAHSAPLTAARAAGLLHTTAAALALGLIGGLYMRGLVLDYRAGWQSTFLDAGTVHALLSWLLAPASWVSGLGVPDEHAIEALRVGGAQGGPAAASAAPWIHLYAVTLVIAVVLPRSLLVAVSVLRAAWLSRRFPLSLRDPYFERLAREQRGEAPEVVVVPYAQAPGAQAGINLRMLLAAVLGDSVRLQVRDTVRFGDEDEAGITVAAPHSAVVALFNLGSTPEPEHQGRFVEVLRTSVKAPVVMLVDEAAFRRRFAALPERLAARRDAWRKLAAAHAASLVCADLESPDLLRDAEPALREALRRP